MLNNVPTGINKLVRQVVINHPNTWNGYVLRKQFSESKPQTIGMVGILSPDEDVSDDFELNLLGECFAMQVDGTAYQAGMNDYGSSGVSDNREFRFLIEPEPEPDSESYFSVKKGDVLFLIFGGSVEQSYKPAYEIVDIETVGNIAPFNVRYITNRRADLDNLGFV